MNPTERADQLHRLLLKLHVDYHRDDVVKVPDTAYDRMLDQLRTLVEKNFLDESKYPILSKVGEIRVDNRDTMRNHHMPMYSLGKMHEVPDAVRWMRNVITRVMREDSEQRLAFNLEYKLDGISLELIYRHGILCEAVSRGDGQVGTTALDNALRCPNIPNHLPELEDIRRVVVHGEVYVTLDMFKRYGRIFTTVDYNNPRAMAGSFLAKHDPRSNGHITFCFNPHEVVEITDAHLVDADEDLLTSAQDRLSWLCKLGSESERFQRLAPLMCKDANLSEITLCYGNILDTRNELAFAIDGLVLSVDNLEQRNFLGYTAREPRWAMALKFPAAERTSTVKGVKWNVTMNGELTPVLEIDAVEINGNRYDKVPLFNYAYFTSIGELERGGEVKVALRGDVNLQYVEHRPPVTPDGQPLPEHSRSIIRPPTHCPSCEHDLLYLKAVDSLPQTITCPNHSCRGVLIERCRYYVSAVKVKQVGRTAIDSLVTKSFVKHPVDLHSLHAATTSIKGSNGSVRTVSWPNKVAMLKNLTASLQRGFIDHVKGLSYGLLTRACFRTIEQHCSSLDIFIELLENKSPLLSDRIHYVHYGQIEQLKQLRSLLEE